MPTLFRLVSVLGIVLAVGYGALWGMATLVTPQPRPIVEAVVLPQAASSLRSGRSVADVLDAQAATLVRRSQHHPR